jgi:hypothetical protein
MPDSPHSDLRFSGWHALRLDSHWCPRPGWLDTGGHRPSTLHQNHLGSPSIEWVKDNHSFIWLYMDLYYMGLYGFIWAYLVYIICLYIYMIIYGLCGLYYIWFKITEHCWFSLPTVIKRGLLETSPFVDYFPS